jgi:hypothetical protein
MNVDWAALGALATAAAALVTAWMAAMTRQSIRQTQKHHRDVFRPLVVLMPYDGIDPQDRKGLIEFKGASDGNEAHALWLHGTLQNIGVGPALNLRLQLAVMNPDDIRAVCELSPMKASELRQGPKHNPGGQCPLKVPVQLSQRFNDTDFQMAPNGPWSISLEYEDVFGQRFRTCHASSRHASWTMTEVCCDEHWVRA